MTKWVVTGGAGFIGSHLVEKLLERGDTVVALDNLSTGQSENLERVRPSPRFTFVQGSILDELLVDELVHDCDRVVHLAAAVGVRLIVEAPLRSLTTNIRGAEVVLGAALRYGRPILVASSSEIYGRNGQVPLSETSDRVLGVPTVSRWAYSTAKAVDEVLALAYWKERSLPTTVVRLFNTVGPRQSAAYGMVIPRFVAQGLSGSDLTVYGNGSQTRCFCHVHDVVDALVRLLDSDRSVGEVFNIGSSEEISMAQLAQRIVFLTGGKSSISYVSYEEAYEPGFEDMQRRVPDTRKVRRAVGWEPRFTLDDILTELIGIEAPTGQGDARAVGDGPRLS